MGAEIALGYQATGAELHACSPTGVACNRAEEDRRRALHLGNTSALIGAERVQAQCVRARLGLPAR